jgi:mRNA-degrading endonuclease RelE of RelBE toxin-antitoxin system
MSISWEIPRLRFFWYTLYDKTEICRFAEVTDKEIRDIKINSVPKKHKRQCKNTKTIIRLRLGDYRGIFTSTSSRRNIPSLDVKR